MKKIILVILFLLSINFCYNLEVTASIIKNEEYVSRYKTYSSNLSEEELVDYYLKNNITPASSPDGTADLLYINTIETHLQTRFPNYSNWSVSNNNGYVGDTYGDNPKEIRESANFMQTAKTNANINYKAIGCGPLAMYSQFDFLARNAGYVSISENLEDIENAQLTSAPNATKLATAILDNTSTIAADSELAQIFGVDPNIGTFTFPSEVIDSSMELLENYHLAVKKTKDVIDSDGNVTTKNYYDDDSQIIVTGDEIPNLSFFDTKVNNLIDSIDRGMPVIWWTIAGNGAGAFSNHYMNIFGYEYWKGTDSSGNIKEHLFFILRYNWGKTGIERDVYMDSEALKAVNGGFIFFEETHEKTVIKPSDYGYACQYLFENNSKIVNPSYGESFNTNYLRTGYVNRYDSTNTIVKDQQISLSAKREGAGIAYIHYQFNTPVKWIYLEASMWSSSEGLSSYNGEITIDYMDHLGNWNTQLSIFDDIGYISKLIDSKSKIRCDFEYPVTNIRIYVKSNNPTGDRNKGRVVLGNIIAIHEEYEHTYTYISNGKSGHTAICSCGQTSTQMHAVSTESTNGRYANCIYCGYLIDLGSDIVIRPMSNQSILSTINGSYIYNDVILLVDADVEAYMNNALVFYVNNQNQIM